MPSSATADLIEGVETLRQSVSAGLDSKRRVELGQFLTPLPIACLMASMLGDPPDEIRLLDPGAGIGSLTAATVADLLERPHRPNRINVTAYEVDSILADHLRTTL